MELETLEQLQNVVALVTGAAGFIGGHLCRLLHGLGARVHGTSRQARRAETAEAFHTVDLTEPRAVMDLFARIKPDYVFHLASHVSGSRDHELVAPTLHNNLVSTINLLNAAVAFPCKRLVLAGSLEEPDEGTGAPTSPYAASKAAAAMYGRMFWQLYRTPVTIARLFMVYGPDQPDTRKLVPYVTLSLLSGRVPRMTSGQRPVDWVHVEDVAQTLVRSALAPGLEGQTIDVGTGRLTTVRGVAEQISQLVGGAAPEFGAMEDRALEQVRAANPAQAEQLLGRPMIELERGLADTVRWYRQHLAEEPAAALE